MDQEKEGLIMTQEHANVLNIIKSAEHKYISSTDILAKLNKDKDYHRKLQQIISELVNDFEIPIGSSSTESRKGYFYCETDYDYHIAKRALVSRVDALTGRLSILEKCHLKSKLKA